MSREAVVLTITGVVQGVGFRPFVYREANTHGITGWVLNTVEGVTVHAEGEPDDVDRFVVALSQEAPAAAQIREIDINETSLEGFDTFEIRFSKDSLADRTTLVSPDLATCDACVEELFDQHDRRYHYPFINCTNCGPRFTIMRALPYDRTQTSMEPFTMCSSCQTEYDDPANRRFHAQPDACFECGPHIGWARVDAEDGVGGVSWAHTVEESDEIIACAVEVLHRGGIVAVKGLGGYHLVCDAADPEVLARLRERKHREGKAFAVMMADVNEARQYCYVNDAEEKQLRDPARPIVLLQKLPNASFASGLADDLPELGVMLPATPVQHLLMRAFGGMLVMTSGNIHDEPIVTDEVVAFEQLGCVADAFLVNDRAIEGRYDDSVLRVLDAGPAGKVVQFIRRARGYAPLPLSIPCLSPQEPDAAEGADPSVDHEDVTPASDLFAVGSEQKSTFTFVRGGQAFVSQHIGDMESVAVMDAWGETRKRYQELFRLQPKRLVCDYHPEYLTSKWAHDQHERSGMPLVQVQHHHAHILSVMGENGLEGPVCGFAFDGTGYGLDGAIWGGEVLLSNLQAFERFANFAYTPLPGGAAAIKNPARIAYGALWAFDLLDHPMAQRFVEGQVPDASTYLQMIEKGINSPQTSSVGRLFDAASALLGVCTKPRYEGEAAILLEAEVHKGIAQAVQDQHPDHAQAYRIELIKNVATETSTATDTSVLLLDAAPVFEAMLNDLEAGLPVTLIARWFHDAFVRVMEDMAELIRATYDINTIALGGGVFMNRYLVERTLAQLQERGFTIALNWDLPPNDASISYGQAVLGLQTQIKE